MSGKDVGFASGWSDMSAHKDFDRIPSGSRDGNTNEGFELIISPVDR